MTKRSDIAERLSKLKIDSKQNVLMNSTVADTVKEILGGIENNSVKLKVNSVSVDKKTDNSDYKRQQDVSNSGKVWGDDLKADISLIDKTTNKEIDRVKSIKLATIPAITDRLSYSIKGNEYQFTNQARLKPGVYTKRQRNGEISSFFNVDKTIDFDRGFNNNFKINFNPEKKAFIMTYGAKNVPLINALRVLGATESELEKSLGKDVYDANNKAYTKNLKRDQEKLYSSVFGKTPEDGVSDADIAKQIRERLFDTKLDKKTTKITLGKEYGNVNKNTLLDATKKIVKINKGEIDGDDREALVFKEFVGAEDHVREKLVKSADKIRSSTAFKLAKTRSINKSLSTATFDPFVTGTITTSKLSAPPNQTNIMSMLGNATKFTLMGEGGIGSSNAISDEVRAISNSELGFVDPLHTPEGSSIGVSVHTTMDTVKLGNELYSKVYTKDGKSDMLTPMDLWDKNVAFPSEYKNLKFGEKAKANKDKVRVVNAGEFKEVKPSDVDFIIPDSKGMFNFAANSVPFVDSLQGNRGLTASKMQEQALSLVDRDKPLFKVVDAKGNSIAEQVGGVVAAPKSPVAGEVVEVTDDNMTIKDAKGKKHKVGLYNNFSLNSESFLTNEAKVAVGDKVKKGQLLADNNFTRDGQLSLGANLRVAYIPFKGYNYEDSAIMSESAAKKLTSSHMYDFKAKRSSKGVFNREKFKAYFPEEIDAKKARKLDKDGVVKVGQTVDEGDILIAHMERKAPTADDIAMGRLDKQLKRDMSNDSLKWEKGTKGVVTSVKKSGNSVVVNVKTEEKFKVADKISGVHGNKHIISKIVPDHEMPFDPRTGKYIDLTMSPIGVSNRINTSQLLENAAGKIAEATGKQYNVKNFSQHNNSKQVMEDLKKAGLSDKDILINPKTGKPFRNKVANGISHILKLEHVIDHKFSSRYKDGYDANEQATTGGHHGGKKAGRMEMAAILARDGIHNAREMFDIKGQRNDEFWRAMETGAPLPPPKQSFVWDKQLAMMKGAGINVEQKGKSYALRPMTDKDIEELSAGKLGKPSLTYRKKDLAPMKEGLFDPIKAGGMQGDFFTHFELPEETLNPITAAAAASISNISKGDVDDIMAGKKFVDKGTGNIVKPGTKGAISGGPGMRAVLRTVNVDKELNSAEDAASKTRNRSQLNKLHKKIRTLKFLKESGMKPTDYLVKNVLVTPSKFRPMFSMGNEGTVIMSDINDLYQAQAQTGDAMKDLAKELKSAGIDDDTSNALLADSRAALYSDMKAISGLGKPTSYLHAVKDKKGYISQIDGGKAKQTKTGFFQSKVLERRQDLTGRSTVILNPELGSDQIGIPEKMATDIFRPFIMKEITGMGYSLLEAKKAIEDESDIFKRARQIVADKRLVIANRAPSLHRYSMTGFEPVLTKGKAIEVPTNVIAGGFGGDFDGDTFQIHTPVGDDALEEAKKMKPSSSMLKVGWDSVLNQPGQDVTTGVWLASNGKSGIDTGKEYKNVAAVEDAVKAGEISNLDTVTIDGRKATAGMHSINSVVPDDVKKWDVSLDKGTAANWIKEVTKKHNGKIALNLADKMKDVGNEASTEFGLTLGVSDTIVDESIRKPLLDEAAAKSKGKSAEVRINAYHDAKMKGQKALIKKHGDKTMLGVGMTSGGSKGIGNTTAITMMPGVVTDANDRPIDIPITSSYSEGLDEFEYWAAAHGARGGNIKKSVSSFLPGWFTKDLMNSIYDTRITDDKPMDTVGLEYDIKKGRNVVNRYLAQDAKDNKGQIIAKRNEVVTSDVINKLNQHGVNKIHVQSPLTDPTPGDGFSSFSYGLNYNGERPNVGDNIGIKSAHTITEPSLNLAMKSFHTGGAMTKGSKNVGTAFDAMDRIFRFTRKLPDKAGVATLDGSVKSVSKSSVGGWDVLLKDKDGKEENVYIDGDRTLSVKKGDKVKKGDIISDGTASPHDILKTKGMRETQKYLVDKVSEINDHKLDHRELETVVRGITNTTRVLKPGSNNDYTAGDVAPLTTIEFFNNNRKREGNVGDMIGMKLDDNYGDYKKGTRITSQIADNLSKFNYNRVKAKADKIEHEPFLTPTGIAAKAASSEDWIARLGHNRLRAVLEEGTTQGWVSTPDKLKGNPFVDLVAGRHTW